MTLKLMFEVVKVPEMILWLMIPRDASGCNRKAEEKTLTFLELSCLSFKYDVFRS